MEISRRNNKHKLFLADAVTVRFGGLTALEKVSMEVQENEIRGLIGPNGAGKTTFFNVATGYIPAESGNLFFLGENISLLKPHQIAKLGIIRTFQKRGIVPHLTALENVLMGYHRLMSNVKLWHAGCRLREFRSEESKAISRAMEALESVGLPEVCDSRAMDLSFGQQTLVEIARVIVSRPNLLMLDEPAAGLSVAERDHLIKVLRKLRTEERVSLIISDHVMDFVMEVCEVITVLNFGKVLAEGSADHIRRQKAVTEAYLGGGGQ